MNIVEKKVIHRKLGEGIVVSCDEKYITVCFSSTNATKQFKFPDAFDDYLCADDIVLQNELNEIIAKEKEAAKARREQKRKNEAKMLQEEQDEAARMQRKRHEGTKSIAIKCNFCDGGLVTNGIGFAGLCSDEVLRDNVKNKKRSECCDSTRPCFQYCEGSITREELEASEDICYESRMLIDWRAYAGWYRTGPRKGEPMTFREIAPQCICVLTTREPQDNGEEDRLIFGIFYVNSAYEGDSKKEGYVQASSDFRISFSLKEARNFKFWDYFQNKDGQIAWNSGLHRYLTNFQAIAILEKACEIKKGTDNESLTKDFLNYYRGIVENK